MKIIYFYMAISMTTASAEMMTTTECTFRGSVIKKDGSAKNLVYTLKITDWNPITKRMGPGDCGFEKNKTYEATYNGKELLQVGHTVVGKSVYNGSVPCIPDESGKPSALPLPTLTIENKK